MKLLCFTHCFSLCSCQRTVEQKALLLSETLILTVEAGQRMFSRQLCYRKLCEFVKRKSGNLATEPKSSNLKSTVL